LLTILLVIVGSFVVSTLAQTCADYKENCNECSSQPGCGFCYATQLCLSGTEKGPESGNCLLGWMFNGTQCTNCPAVTNCGACNSQPQCGWCPAERICISTSPSSNATCLIDEHCSCNKYLDCYSCIEEYGCSWCSAYQTCENIRYTTCSFLTHTCPACSNYSTCTECQIQPNCVWCVAGASQSCQPPTNCSSSQTTFTCDQDCQRWTSCSQCTRQTDCGWCNAKQICAGFDSTDPVCGYGSLVQFCPDQTPSFSATSFVGGMFLVIGLGLVAFAFFFAYRYYKKRQTNYTEV